jgi:hypothetical protein
MSKLDIAAAIALALVVTPILYAVTVILLLL